MHGHTHVGIHITHAHTSAHTCKASAKRAINTGPEDAGHASYLHFECVVHSIVQIVMLLRHLALH